MSSSAGFARLADGSRRTVHGNAAPLRRHPLRLHGQRHPERLRPVQTVERIYQQRVGPAAAGFSASPIAADGKLYLTSEDGDIFVVRAGRTFELLATNQMGETLMATPAISGNMLIVKTQTQLVGIGS